MWFWFAFGSALLGSVDVILNKRCLKNVSATVLTWSLFALSLPLLFYMALFYGLPSVNQLFYIGVIGSATSFVFAKTLQNVVIKQQQLSKIFPLTAFAGVFTYVLGLLFLSESIQLLPVIGLFSVIIGSYILNLDQAKENFLKPFTLLFTQRASLLFLLALFLNSVTSLFDKIGVINTYPTNPVFTLLVENLIMIMGLTIYLCNKEPGWINVVRNNFSYLFLNSSVFLITSLLVFSAFVEGPMALVMGVKRLQIFFILLMSYFLFKDKPGRHIWLASFIMAIGTVLIKLG